MIDSVEKQSLSNLITPFALTLIILFIHHASTLFVYSISAPWSFFFIFAIYDLSTQMLSRLVAVRSAHRFLATALSTGKFKSLIC